MAVTCEIFSYGESMRRVFNPGDTLRLVQTRTEDLRCGDIAVAWHGDRPVAHRVIRKLPDGALVTMGDNNGRPDQFSIRPGSEVWLVTAYRSAEGETWHPVHRGGRGMAEFYLHRVRRQGRHWAKVLLRPLKTQILTLRPESEFRDFKLYGSPRHPGSVRVMKNGQIKWQKTWMRLFYRLPEK